MQELWNVFLPRGNTVCKLRLWSLHHSEEHRSTLKCSRKDTSIKCRHNMFGGILFRHNLEDIGPNWKSSAISHPTQMLSIILPHTYKTYTGELAAFINSRH